MHTCAGMPESSLLALVHENALMYMKTRAKIKIASHPEYVSMGLQKRLLRIIR